MLQTYRAHVAERAALGIPPLPLSAKQTGEVIELLKNPPSGEEATLVDLITHRVPAGVDDAEPVVVTVAAAAAAVAVAVAVAAAAAGAAPARPAANAAAVAGAHGCRGSSSGGGGATVGSRRQRVGAGAAVVVGGVATGLIEHRQQLVIPHVVKQPVRGGHDDCAGGAGAGRAGAGGASCA